MICKKLTRLNLTREASTLLASFFLTLSALAQEHTIPGAQGSWYVFKGDELTEDQNLGFRLLPNNHVNSIFRTKDQVIWNVNINTDQHSRRMVPFKGNVKAEKFLAFFGCSFVYGTGLNDNETLPYYVAKQLPHYRVYNYGIGASSAHLFLALLEEGKLQDQIAEKNGILVYVLMGGHLGRANAFMSEAGWNKRSPYYKYNASGELVRAGNFETSRPVLTSFYTWLWPKIERWATRRINFPPVLDSHIQYTCDLIKQSQKVFNEMYPHSKFVVTNHPLSSAQQPLWDCLKRSKIDLLDYDPRMDREEYRVPIDGHPTAMFNRDYGKMLADWLIKLQ